MTRRPGQRTTVRVMPRLLAAAFVAAACSDSLSPRPKAPTAPPPAQRAPEVLQSAAGDITLDQQNSTLGLAGRRLLKGFNPTNPHNGDAIVVTFFWIGSTNIIDSVTDHLTNPSWTKVGNSYHLVEYTTAGGISMATYVATNVQNIPVANPAQDNVLAIEASLSDSVADGGIWMSAWSGVDGVFPQAVGVHPSGSGAGSSPTVAQPGPMTVNAGALVYGVTMTNALVGLGTPTGFRSIDPGGSISDARMKADGEYTVPASTGSFDPQWTWYFDQSHAGTWLATGIVLNPGSPPPPTPPGNLTVTTSTSGSNLDPDGYTVTVDGTTSQPIGINASVTFSNLPAGTHSVAVAGVASNCTVTTANPQSVSVPSGGTTTASAPVSCGAASVGGIVLDTMNGNLGETGRLLLTRFGPRNPHHGDAIVATFFWSGSRAVITSVTDRLSDGTPVGNTYTPVEYDTAGGMSIATYVATNVQNYPEGTFPGGDKLLVVQAQLSDSVADGGLMISAWGGVDGVSAQAVGAHQSRSGSGSQPTVAAPGPIAVNAGALAYGVTMSGTLVGRDRPSGFANITSMSDGAGLIAEGDYAVPAAAGQVDPRWTWSFSSSSPGTWLATVIALNPGTTPALGNLTVSTSTSGANLDPDGYTVAVDGGPGQAIGINGSLSFTNQAAGSHSVTLSGVAVNCTVTGGNSQTVTVPSGGTATAAFTVSCSAATGNLTVTTSTTGSNLDPDGYAVTVDGGSPQVIGINASTSYPGLPAGSHTVAISGVAANCTVTGGNSQTVSVPSGGTATAAFTVSCSATTGDLTVTTSTSGSSLDPDGYTVTVDGGSPQALGINASVSYPGLSAGSHTVAISGVATNCTVSGGPSQTVSVPSGGTATTAFSVSCVTPPGNLTVSTSTTGSSLDPDGYTVTVDGGSPQAIGINASVTYTSLTAGSHTVAISGVATNCTVSGGTSQPVSVPSGGTATTTFSVSCVTPPGNLTVSTSTAGSSLDPDGYTVTVDGGSPQAIGINASVSYTNLTAGNHTVAISGVATNCTVSGGTSRAVSVPSGSTATTTFSVSCVTPPGNLTASTSTTGSSLDPDGYTVTVDGGSPQAIGINASVTYTSLTAGNHTVAISGVATNCTVSGSTSRTVSVPSGGTATTTFSVSCVTPNSPPVVNAGSNDTAITGLLYSISPSFSDANDGGPWSYRIDWGDGSVSTGTLTSQGSWTVGHTYVIILPQSFTITVTVTDSHGASGSGTKVVSVLLL